MFHESLTSLTHIRFESTAREMMKVQRPRHVQLTRKVNMIATEVSRTTPERVRVATINPKHSLTRDRNIGAINSEISRIAANHDHSQPSGLALGARLDNDPKP